MSEQGPSPPADPKRVVETGSDRIAERYAAWSGAAWTGSRARYGRILRDRLPEGSRLVDLGCGTGLPTARALAEHFAVVGVDLSARSIELARRNVPAADFRRADMAAVDFPPASVDGVAAFYSIIHLPRTEHPAMLQRIARWLRPGGLLVATLGAGDVEAVVEDDWLGAPMFWSHHDAATNRRLVAAAGLRLLEANLETEEEDGAPVSFLWVVAEKPPPSLG